MVRIGKKAVVSTEQAHDIIFFLNNGQRRDALKVVAQHLINKSCCTPLVEANKALNEWKENNYSME